ncbi:Uncharacterized protein CLAVI_000146 [Candidatus Clavichlamydia salmonicola]|uniref:aminotransferase class V-fold PLP-dependent enzyme n=1 Tax=Candidatus Clavichlamydia salmonicola TaxID=469812 RepID=UPI00189157B1|nr:aminotransferase class V-fold PLP-dependent enzyme [Candidatus Clavichlamydia salmonicola]MBF5050536.1 Uncharacterized protein [Candidatus Clavichlamydia salmonicola]
MMIWLNNQQAAHPNEKLFKTFQSFSNAFPVSTQFDKFTQGAKDAEKHLRQLANIDDSYQFFFTSSGTEAIKNVFLYLFLQGIHKKIIKRIAIPSTDEQATIHILNELQRYNAHYDWIRTNENGVITAKAVETAINNKASIISMPWADGLTGIIHPLNEIMEVCQDKGALIHVNATHILGKGYYPFEVHFPDFLSFDGLPLHSLSGTGGIFIKNQLITDSLLFSNSLNQNFFSNTYHPALPIVLGEAAFEMSSQQDRMCMETLRLRNFFEESLSQAIPGIQILFKEQERLPNVSLINFSDISAETLAFLLYQKNIYGSIGYGNFQGLSMVLQACGISPLLCHSTISFALSRLTTQEEVIATINAITDCITQLKKRSYQPILSD